MEQYRTYSIVYYKVIDLKDYYSVEETEKIFNSFVVEPIIVHKERFETEHERRDRILGEITK